MGIPFGFILAKINEERNEPIANKYLQQVYRCYGAVSPEEIFEDGPVDVINISYFQLPIPVISPEYNECAD